MPLNKNNSADCTEYLVFPGESGSWLSRLAEREAGPYATRDMALRVAITDALQLRAAGRGVRITVQDARGNTCAVRCLCERFTCSWE
jgi:hypothetical protein